VVQYNQDLKLKAVKNCLGPEKVFLKLNTQTLGCSENPNKREPGANPGRSGHCERGVNPGKPLSCTGPVASFGAGGGERKDGKAGGAKIRESGYLSLRVSSNLPRKGEGHVALTALPARG
jgi:hypothetical protein